MEIIQKILYAIAGFSIFAAVIVPDYIAGVNKAMRMGKAHYPKEKRKKKWKWIGIFVLIAVVSFGLSAILFYLA